YCLRSPAGCACSSRLRSLRTPQRSRNTFTLSSPFGGAPPSRLFLRGNHLRFLVPHCSGGHESTAPNPRRGACLAVRLQPHLLGLLRAAPKGLSDSTTPLGGTSGRRCPSGRRKWSPPSGCRSTA